MCMYHACVIICVHARRARQNSINGVVSYVSPAVQPAVSLLTISTTSSPHNDQRDKRGHVSANYCKSALASKGVPQCLLPGRTAHRRLSSSPSSPVQRSHCLAQSSHRHPVRCSTRRRPPRVSCASRCGRYLRSGAVRRGYQHRRGARA